MFGFELVTCTLLGDEVSHGSGALLQYQFRRPMNTPQSRGSQGRGDPVSPGQVEAGFGQVPGYRQTVSAATAGVGPGTGVDDAWMTYLKKRRASKATRCDTTEHREQFFVWRLCRSRLRSERWLLAARFCHTARCYKPRVSSNWSSKFRRISLSCFSELRSPASRIGHEWCRSIWKSCCSQRCLGLDEPTGDASVVA